MQRMPNWIVGLALGSAVAFGGATAAPAAHAQEITETNLAVLKQLVDAEVAKGPNNNASQVWGLFNQLQKLTVQAHTSADGTAIPAGPLHGNADANYTLAKIGWFLLKNVAGNPDMFGGWVWPRTNERINWALKQNANHPEAWLLWGHIHRDRIAGHNWAQAERGFRFDLQLNPDRLESMRYHVLALLQLGKAAEALQAVDAYLAKHANAAALHALRGDALYSLGRYLEARAAYAVSAELQLGDGQILDKVKNADLKHQEATTGRPMPDWYLKFLAKYYEKHPRQTISEEKRGHLLWTIWEGLRQGQGLENAQPWGQQCIDCFAGLEQAFPQAGARAALWCDYQAEIHRWYLELAKLEATVLRGLEANPASQAVMDRLNLPTEGVNLFDYYKRHEQYAKGISFVERLLPLLPAGTPLERARRAVMHQFAFECHKGLAQFTKAEASIRAAMESDPRNSVYPNSYGLMLRYTGDLDGAATQFKNALEIAPSHPWAAQNLAGLLMARQQWSAFHDHCSQALYWAQDNVEQAKADLAETTDPQRVNGAATQAEIAAAQETLDAARHDLLKMRRLWAEGLQLERAAAKR